LDFAQYAIAITSIDSNLDKLAKSEAWLATFPCTTGWEGALLCRGLALPEGIDIRAMLAGAQDGRRHHTPQIKTTQLLC